MTSPGLLAGASRLIEAVGAPDSEVILDTRTSAALDALEAAYAVEVNDQRGVLSAIEVLARALRDDRFGGDYSASLSLATRLELMAMRYREKTSVAEADQLAPYAHDGQEYVIITWDWKGQVPLEDIYQAVHRGFAYGAWVPDMPTDDYAVVASRVSEFDAQTVYNAFENDPAVWGDDVNAAAN